MWISSINIKNYRLFPLTGFKIEDINIPDKENEGSGLNVFVGENGCGKTSLLEALSLPFLQYKADRFTVDDLNDLKNRAEIEVIAGSKFKVDKTVPRSSGFMAKGFKFDGGIRSRESMYLSSMITSYRWFIPVEGENVRDNSPDLRIDIDNPYTGSRFKENDFLFLDERRVLQIRSGAYNKTRFDRLMEDFNYQYIDKQKGIIKSLSDKLDKEVKADIKNEFLTKAVERFKKMTGIPITLELIDNYLPFRNAFFGQKMENGSQVKINKLGSGYEMIFSLLYSFYLAQQSRKQLIVLLDEPEIHLHPKLQEDFVDVLLELSKTSQIILTTQSPLLVKQLSNNRYKKINILQKKGNGDVEVSPIDKRVLPSPSANEINYVAFNLATPEYHNELYSYLQEISQNTSVSAFDNYLQQQRNVSEVRPYIDDRNGQSYDVTLCTYIRNQIHHPDNKRNTHYTPEELEQSIKILRDCLPS